MAVLYIRYSENQRSAAYLRFYRNRNDGRNDYYLSRRGGGLDSDTDKIGYYDDFADRFYPNYSSINISLTAGDDVVTFDRNQRIRTYIFGKGGSDTLVFNADYGENLTINLNDGDSAYDETRVTFTSIENVTGGPRNDVLTGTDQANRINGGRGNDTLRGGNGNDQLDGGIGSDTLSGGNGDDVISMGDRTGEDIDTANGGAGADLFLVVDRDGTPSPRQPEADIFNPSMVISALDSLYGKTKLIGAGNPLIAMALSVGTDVAAQWLRQIISSGGAASEPNYAKEDYVQITDFNPVEDMFIYKTESTGAWFNNDMGKIQYHADSNTNNTGGLLAVLTIDDDLVEKIRLETKMSDISVRERLSRSQSLQTLYLRKNSSGKAEIQLPGQNFRSVEGIVSQDGLNENETRWKNSVIQAANAYVENSSPGDIVIVTGAFSSAIIQGEDLPDDNTQRLMSGTRFGDVFYSYSSSVIAGPEYFGGLTTYAFGWGGDDTMFGSKGKDVFYGGDGADQLEGGDGDDHLYGGEGNDSLYGMNGNNHFYGGAGYNGINGSGRVEDSNTLHYGPELGYDTVRDFAGSNDRLIIDAGVSWGNIACQQTGNDLNLSVGAGGMIVVKDHFAGKGIESFQLASQIVTANQVNLLIQAMGASGGSVSAAPLGSVMTTRTQDSFSIFG